MRTRMYSANFFLNSCFFFLLLLIPFFVVRAYFYFNYFFPSNNSNYLDFFRIVFTGLRFDLCIIGFLLLPSYFFYILSYSQKLFGTCVFLNQIYKVVVLGLIFLVFHFNLPFFAQNSRFDLPFWMRWEDYQSLFLIDCQICYWDYNYLEQVIPIQIIAGFIFMLILFASVSRWRALADRFNWKREILFFAAIFLMARGNLGQYHLRYEDSVWHSNPLVNELSNNPLWLMDKVKSDRRLRSD